MMVYEMELGVLVLACVAGLGYLLVAALAVLRFVAHPLPTPEQRPPVTLLKPLHGDEPNLYDTLRSFCDQAYPTFQLVFGVGRADDPAAAVVERLRADLPGHDIALVIDGRLWGANYKIGNLINMMPAAKHDLLVIADSDMRVTPDYLDAVVAPLVASRAEHRAGLVTCLYRGRPLRGLWSELGSQFINHGFLGQVLVGRWLGVDQGCFGATMALSRQTLERVGGLPAFMDQLADDYALGAAVRGLGLPVVLSPLLVETQVHEPSATALTDHELRWARTLGSIAPVGYGASIITQPLLPALLLLAVTGFAPFALAIFVAVLAARMVYNRVIDAAIKVRSLPPWQIPLRDLLSVAVLITSFCGSAVTWREHKFRVESDGQLTRDGDVHP
jgi:ceramide glucosyltransferase